MASGRDMQLTRQIGEYLVAAELGRRGWIATTFTGSVPGFDILAVNGKGRMIEVQVKAIRSGSWQLNAGQYIEIEVVKGVQHNRGMLPCNANERICVFVRLLAQGQDEFYVFGWRALQEIIHRDYAAGRRPKNPETRHHALYPKHIAAFKDNWTLLEDLS